MMIDDEERRRELEEEWRAERAEEYRREEAEDARAALEEEGREARKLRAELDRMKEWLEGAKFDRQQAEEEATEAEEGKRKAEKEAECAKKKARTAEKRMDAALRLKKERNDALEEPSAVAADLYKRLEGELTEEERSLRDWLNTGESGNKWGAERIMAGKPGSKAYVSGLRKSIERKYHEAGYQGAVFPRHKGGRPSTRKMVEASGTAEKAELRGRLAERTRTPTRRKAADD